MKSNFLLLIPLSMLLLAACLDDSDNALTTGIIATPSGSNDWLVPENEIYDGGTGIDGIPSIDTPMFKIASEVTYLDDEDLVLGIQIGDDIRAYPHPSLDWHEVVNDVIGDIPIAVTYCPLTGTGIGWDRIVNSEETTFGVSGLLYNSNMMPYDRATGSVWSQHRLDCVNGDNSGVKATTHVMIETSWNTWLSSYPNSRVLDRDTTGNIDYDSYPYGNYKTSSSLRFPVANRIDSLFSKDRVLGVIVSDSVSIYPFASVTKDSTILIRDTIQGSDVIVIQNDSLNLMVAFVSDQNLEYTPLTSKSLPAIVKDSEGASFDMFGRDIKDPNRTLSKPTQMMGYWFSWAAFYPDLELYDL